MMILDPYLGQEISSVDYFNYLVRYSIDILYFVELSSFAVSLYSYNVKFTCDNFIRWIERERERVSCTTFEIVRFRL